MGKPIKWSTLILLGLTIITGLYLRSESWIETTVRHPIQGDASDYYYYAYNMRKHHTYSRQINPSSYSKYQPAPDAVRSPGYPLALSLLIDSPPSRKLIKKIELFQMLLSSLTLLIAFYFFRCFLPLTFGGVAAILVALSPHLIIYNSYLLAETFFCFALILVGILVSRFARKPSIWFSIMLGSLMGMAALIRPSLQFFPFVMAIIIMIHYGRKAGLKLGVSVLLGFILTMAPWYIRNIASLGKVSDKSLMINFLHHGMYPDFRYQQMPESYRRPYQFDPRAAAVSSDLSSILKEIMKRIREDPAKHLKWFLLKKPAVFWSWNSVQGHGDIFVYYVSRTPYFENKIFQWSHLFMRFIHGPLVILSLIGSLLIWMVPQPMWLNKEKYFVAKFAGALLLYYTILHMIGAPFPRYSVPLKPIQYGMSMMCIYNLYCFIKSKGIKNQV
jgi:hypothetical protein